MAPRTIELHGPRLGPPLVFIPLQVSDEVRGEVLAVSQVLRPGLPARLPSADNWRAWLAQLVADSAALPGYATLKYSKSGEVFRARIGGENEKPLEVVCRFSRSGGVGDSILNRASRGRRNFRRAVQLLHAGIDTAIPLARMERIARPRSSWLVTEFVGDVVDLDQIVLTLLSHLDRNAVRKVKATLTGALVELFARLDGARLYHRDLKASNILFTHWNGREGPARTMLVDLDGLHHRRWWNGRRRWQPLIRLAASLRDYPALSRTDFVRFLHQHLSRVGTPTADWKACFRRFAREAAGYAQRSQRRKSHKLDGFTGG